MDDKIKLASELFDISGRVALVTGASSGIGARAARLLAAHGAKVVVGARRRERLDTLVADIKEAGGEALAVSMDVTKQADIDAAFDAAEDAFGPITILMNNAGVGQSAMVLDQDGDEWRRVMDTNLDAVWFVAQQAAQRMAKAGTGGNIINVASMLGLTVAKGLSAYCVAKAGVIQLTKSMALELAKLNIRVNAIAPGYIKTEIIGDYFETERGQETLRRMPMKRIAEPHELDGTILLLASDASSFTTGDTLVVDGGHLLPVVY